MAHDFEVKMLNFDCLDTAEDTAFHEAGHLISGTAVGCRPQEVYIRSDGTGGVKWLDRAEGQSIAQLRRELIHCVAGPVAEFLNDADRMWYTRCRWADRLDPGDWEVSYRLLSARIRRGETGDGVSCDTTMALFNAREVCRRLRLQNEGRWDERRVRSDWFLQDGRADLFWDLGYTVTRCPEPDQDSGDTEIERTGPTTPPEVTNDEILAEVVRAERWAERLLKRRWAAVKAVANALFESPAGRLSGEEVMLLGATALAS